MPRSNRNNMANGLHHVTQRGLHRAQIVLNEDDRSHWWRLFDRVALRYQWRVFAVVLLDNHFHIYLRTPVPNLSEGMRDLNGGYSSAFNQRHEREGPLFQGRFKSIRIENDSHSWEVSRYVHLNPYRAGIVEHPMQYRWSTYRFYLDGSHAPAWLDSRTVLAEFAATESAARIAYKRFVEAGMSNPPANPLQPAQEAGVLGSPEFIQQCQAWLSPDTTTGPTLDDILRSVCDTFGTNRDALTIRSRHQHLARDAAVLLARELLSESLDVIANAVGGVSRSAIVEIAKRAREREVTDPTFRCQLETIRTAWR